MADDPMWRGGLAGPASMFLHADRPFIDEDGTSPLIHELIHVITHARAIRGYDWLVEGLAEFYSLQVLQRSGAVSEETHMASLERLRARGRGVVAFDGESAGAETARAVTMMHELDRSIRQETKDEASLDDVLQALVAERTVLDRETFLELVERTSGVTEPVNNLLSRGPKVLLPEE
jgi:predicted metalloprotease with PDZ domain